MPNRSGRKAPYRGPWPTVRRVILERDGWVCQIRGRRCTMRATEVDHIVSVAQGGAWYEPANLRASCKACNLERNQKPPGAAPVACESPSRDW